MVQKRTKTHKLVDITKEIIDKKLCEPCNSKNKSINATYICDNCDENLCEACKKFHMLQSSHGYISTLTRFTNFFCFK
jgi:hypothetical protein